jgi:hypothetical protein
MIAWSEQKRPPSFRPAGFAGLHLEKEEGPPGLGSPSGIRSSIHLSAKPASSRAAAETADR